MTKKLLFGKDTSAVPLKVFKCDDKSLKFISAFSYRSIKNWSATTTVEEQKKNKQLKVNEGKLPVNEGFGERDKLVLQQVMSFRKRIVKACCGLQ